MWVNLSLEEAAAIKELQSLPDRAAGIVGATILESRLGERLKKETADLAIKEKITLHERMFHHSGPLGSFSARINLGFMLKIYDEEAWRDLDIIRSVRNDFAHLTGIGSFNTDTVRDRCGNLKACDTRFSDQEKDHPWDISTAYSTNSLEMSMRAENLEAKRADPRQRYLMCIQYYSAYLSFPFGFQSLHR